MLKGRRGGEGSEVTFLHFASPPLSHSLEKETEKSRVSDWK